VTKPRDWAGEWCRVVARFPGVNPALLTWAQYHRLYHLALQSPEK
jgi:hypothetical protein